MVYSKIIVLAVARTIIWMVIYFYYTGFFIVRGRRLALSIPEGLRTDILVLVLAEFILRGVEGLEQYYINRIKFDKQFNGCGIIIPQ